ncbi:hypothetical protein L1049_018615 [Liquidambar formosana]|uniref:Peptidase A1 domain-containing protein n=1 Tax=Liquidambar formosana TaxID=63359 RepID=A0AAP0WNI8_LIQFO
MPIKEERLQQATSFITVILFKSALNWPAAVCKPSTKGTHNGGEASLKVVHKHGPCSPLFTSKTQIKPLDNLYDPDTTIPAKPDRGAGGYIVTIGLGTPKKELSLIFDTGSDLHLDSMPAMQTSLLPTKGTHLRPF